MLFYRSPGATGAAPGPSLSTLRTLTLVALAAYPAGGIILAAGPDGGEELLPFKVAGLALILIAFIAAAPVIGSRLQRIVGEEEKQLDEWELQHRFRAISSAYATLCALAAALLFYAALASDFGWWLPRSYDAFNVIFWGLMLYATLLPTAFLAWQLGSNDLGEP